MHYLIPLSTNYRDNPDFNYLDSLNEFELLKTRQQAIGALLKGDMHPDDLLDLLDEQDIDPLEYAEAVAEAVDFVIRNQIQVEGWL